MLSLITLIRSVDIPKVGWKKEKKNIIIIPIWRSRLHQLSLTFLMSSTISSSLRLLTRALYPSTMFLSCAMTRIKLFGIPNAFSLSSEDWEFANDLLSVGLKESRPVKLGIFPEIFELKITKYCRIIFFYKALTLKEKDWKIRNTSVVGAERAVDSTYIDPRPFTFDEWWQRQRQHDWCFC